MNRCPPRKGVLDPRGFAPAAALRGARGREAPGRLRAVAVRIEDALADVALHLGVSCLPVHKVGEDNVEPAVNFLEIAHGIFVILVFDLSAAAFAHGETDTTGWAPAGSRRNVKKAAPGRGGKGS